MEKSQKSFKTLILSDIHLNFIRAQRVIESVPHDRVVLTGDYFDSYGSTQSETENTAIWLKENILHNNKIVALLGNHDVSYVFNNNTNFRCSGYSDINNIIINKILNDDDKSKFGVYHIDQGYVFSHAGLTNERWKKYSAKVSDQDAYETKLEYFDRVMKVVAQEAITDAKDNKDVALFAAGWDRGGIYRNGGINWVDWRNLSPIKGINQIVGHSIHRIPQVMIQKVGGGYKKQDVTEYYDTQRQSANHNIPHSDSYTLSISYDLDTHLNHYAVIENGVVDIYHIDTGINLKEINKYNIPQSELHGLF